MKEPILQQKRSKELNCNLFKIYETKSKIWTYYILFTDILIIDLSKLHINNNLKIQKRKQIKKNEVNNKIEFKQLFLILFIIKF